MKRLLMFAYLVLVTSERKPKRRWWVRRRQIDSWLSFAESGVESLPSPGRVEMAHARPKTIDMTPATPSEPKHKAVVEVIPRSLVELEAQTAIRLQMPNRTTPQGIRAYGNDRYDTPIARTLTREKMLKDWRHVPRVAVAHLPVDDVTRLVAKGAITAPQPTSPRRRGTEKKGRPTPKRPRRSHGAQ